MKLNPFAAWRKRNQRKVQAIARMEIADDFLTAVKHQQEQFGEWPLAVLTYPSGCLPPTKDADVLKLYAKARPLRWPLMNANINLRGQYERSGALPEKPYFLL